MKKIQIILLLIISANCFGQVVREWVKRYNGPGNRFDIAATMKLDQQQNVIVYGNTASAISLSDIIAVKYSSSGNLLWQVLFNGYGNSLDECKDALVDSGGNSYITGFTGDTNQVIKIVTIKISSSGSILWSQVFLPPAYNQGMGLSIAKDNSGNIYTCGTVRRQNGSNIIAVIKYSHGGELLDSVFFSKTSSSSEVPVSVCIDNTGYVYILASSNAISGQNDILLLKYNSSLNLIWQNTFSGSAVGNDMPVQMITSFDNKLVIAAAMYNLPGGLDYGIYRFDTNAALIMQYVYNGTGSNQDIPYAITCDTANNIFVTGISRNADTLGSEDFYTMKIDPTALLLWGKLFNGNGRGFDYGTSISVDRRGNVFVGGTTDKHDFHQQYALLKYSSTGDLFWLEEYSKIENSEDFVYTTIADNYNNVFVTGISFDSTSDYDIATIKYSEPIGIQPISNEAPEEFELFQNYPNPFNPSTKIKFSIPPGKTSQLSSQSGREVSTRLNIFDITGKLIEVLFEGKLNTGVYEVEFDAGNLPSGIYFYTLEAGNISKSLKMIVLK